MSEKILLGKGNYDDGGQVFLHPKMANRHGLIAGATGTGKTISLKVMAESFSKMGVPVFMCDIKGDLSGTGTAGKEHPKITERINTIGIENFEFKGYPTIFWDVYGEQGHPIRTTISEFGPLLLSRLLNLNDTQEGVLTSIFKIADDDGLLLLDLKDLKAILNYVDDHKKELEDDYGRMAASTIGAIQRAVVALETIGGDEFFGEPAVQLFDLMKTDSNGMGRVNILAADKLMLQPKLYATFLLWLLSELFETLPEVGDLDKPRLVLFFDEAHLLFDDMPDALLDKIKQVILLIRSKGVGVYFITQNPNDIHEDVLGQLGNRVQHALRVFSPKDRKALKALVSTFPENPALGDLEEVVPQLGVGEALVSCLNEKGLPTPAEKTLMIPPESFMGPLDSAERSRLIQQSEFYGRYDQLLDRDSAHEMLARRAEEEARELAEAEAEEKAFIEKEKEERARSKPVRKSNRQSPMEAFIKSAVRSVGSKVGREIARGILGSMLKK